MGSSNNLTIWRYMAMSKFLDLLVNQRLYFNRLDFFDDKFEGIWPSNSIVSSDERQRIDREIKQKKLDGCLAENVQPVEYSTHCAFANCWYVGALESAAMWRLYSDSNDSIAIKVKSPQLVNAVKECLKNFKNTSVLWKVDLVEYVDYHDETTHHQHKEKWPCFLKHKSYEHEKELRAVILGKRNVDGLVRGIYVPINISEFVEEIIVSPYASPWFFALVKEVVGKYHLKKPVIESKLSNSPFAPKDKLFEGLTFRQVTPDSNCIDINAQDIYPNLG